MKTRICLFASLTILLMLLSNVHGQTDITPKTILINLTVDGSSPSLARKVRAAFLAELKKTPDFKLVDDHYVFGLEVVVYDIRTSTGLNFGIAMSTITTSIVACQDILKTNDLKYRVDRHALTLTDNARLASEVQAIVADLNKRIDPMRKIKVTLLNKLVDFKRNGFQACDSAILSLDSCGFAALFPVKLGFTETSQKYFAGTAAAAA